jgi:hypothetical protein
MYLCERMGWTLEYVRSIPVSEFVLWMGYFKLDMEVKRKAQMSKSRPKGLQYKPKAKGRKK